MKMLWWNKQVPWPWWMASKMMWPWSRNRRDGKEPVTWQVRYSQGNKRSQLCEDRNERSWLGQKTIVGVDGTQGQLVENLSSMHKSLRLTPRTTYTACGGICLTSSIWKVKADRLGVQGHPWLHREFKASLDKNDYIQEWFFCECHTSISTLTQSSERECVL